MLQLLVQWWHLLDDVPADLSLVLQHAELLVELLFLVLWYCTCVLLAVGHICFLCIGHGGLDSLVPLILCCIFTLFATDSGVVWIGLRSFWSLSLDSSSGSILGSGAVLSSTLGSLELYFIIEAGGVGSVSLFGILVSASEIFSNSLIALI